MSHYDQVSIFMVDIGVPSNLELMTGNLEKVRYFNETMTGECVFSRSKASAIAALGEEYFSSDNGD